MGVVEDIRGLLIDIDGVLVVSWRPIDGAVEAVAQLRESGLPLRFATNTTSRTRAELAETLTAVGIPVDPSEILSAPAATAAHLRAEHPGARCLLVSEGDVAADLDGVTLVDDGPVDVVVLGGAGPVFSYESMNRAFACLHDGAALVAMHRNLAWMTAEGLQLDTGGFVRGLEEAAGVDATVIGKPSTAFFAAGAAALGVDPVNVAMVGDDVVNDVEGAQAAGMTGVLVRTGKFEERALDGLSRPPDLVLDSIADLPAALEGR
jgi:HAD superfamily hydrolase (TIGR01458 family)